MSTTPQHGLLIRLLDYIVEQSKEVDPKSYVLLSASDFKLFPKDLTGLPCVYLDRKVEGDHIWLQVARLAPSSPPALEEEARPYITCTDDPNGPPPALHEQALRDQLDADRRSMSEDAAATRDQQRRESIARALRAYIPLWQAWAEGEKPRRRTIALYRDLFTLKGRLEAEEASKPLELVWGMGVAAWKFTGTESGNEKRVSVEYQYPLLTQAVEIDLDTQTQTIAVRPRAVTPRVEFDAFSAYQVVRAAEVENQARKLLDSLEQAPTPFDNGSFEPILKLVAASLDDAGQYIPSNEGPPAPSDHLVVTSGWVLFVRPRSVNFLIEDIYHLKERLHAGDPIPDGPACIVMSPPDEVVSYEPISFRGLCSGGRYSGEWRELYFPLPYNKEQETIVAMLEHAPGVCVQGPPGTGKTHTIANIICHYLATGRKVLVTSKGEHALSVLQQKIPESVRPLTVALLSGDKQGMRQFQTSIEAIVQNLSQLNIRQTREEIERRRQQIDAIHAEIAGIDRRVDEIAKQQLANIEFDGVQMSAQKMAELVVSGQQQHEWFDDDLMLRPEHAPPLSAAEAQALKDARRRLGTDLVYASTRVPSSLELLPAEEMAKLHGALVNIREIEDAETDGELAALRALTPEVLDEAGRMLEVVERALRIVQHLEEVQGPWAFELRNKCRRPEFASELEALNILLTEVDELVRARAVFLQRPVALPAEALGNPKVVKAIERARESGKPFRFIDSLGNGDAKAQVSAIRLSGLPPQTADDWAHVHCYVKLHEKVLSFSVRWNQLARQLLIPEVRPDVEALRSTEETALVVKRAHELATMYDCHLPHMAEKVFREPPKEELLGSSRQLLRVHDQLRRHLTRAKLAISATQRAILEEKLVGTSGPIVERLRAFIDTQLGNPEVATDRIVSHYAELIGEIKRIESLSSILATVNDLCARIERAGAMKWAARLRSQVAPPTGDDEVLPGSWRDAWNWARIKNHLITIEVRDELLKLTQRRHELEKVLARQYEQLVADSAWLETKANASAKVLSALESYRVAIRKIGQGTGPNATRYRRDAQKAMRKAQGAIPCWIMRHDRVSESMPPELGIFDLVIVDEASQSNLWALPAVVRGKKILVVGDDKQVSPGPGFISSARINALRERFLSDQPYGQDLTPEKSLYDLASTVFAAQRVMLKEHFRCVQPIIAYSNKTFYEDKIVPLRVPKASERIDPPLVDVFIKEGVRDDRGINRKEAEFIADEIEAIIRDSRLRNRTIGVVSLLGPEQAKFIYELVVGRVDLAELERRKFECGDAYVFQGSERDIMFLSMVADFGRHHALSGQLFEQRFNVAASRARDRMYLVRSVEPDELSNTDIRRTLIEHFSMPLSGSESDKGLIDLCESGFERDVYSSLVELGYRVTPQVKAGAYRIDMVVEGANDVRLAIECDGDEFHGPDRWPADTERQRILERAGWVFWRCFASTWRLRKEEVLAELKARLQEMEIKPIGVLERIPAVVEKRVWPRSEDDVARSPF